MKNETKRQLCTRILCRGGAARHPLSAHPHCSHPHALQHIAEVAEKRREEQL